MSLNRLIEVLESNPITKNELNELIGIHYGLTEMEEDYRLGKNIRLRAHNQASKLDSIIIGIEKNNNIMKDFVTISGIAKHHWQWVEEMGWHNKTTLECLALIASEVGEAVNECRGEIPTDNFKYELIDILLRTMDLCVSSGIDISETMGKKIQINLAKGTKGRVN